MAFLPVSTTDLITYQESGIKAPLIEYHFSFNSSRIFLRENVPFLSGTIYIEETYSTINIHRLSRWIFIRLFIVVKERHPLSASYNKHLFGLHTIVLRLFQKV